MASTATHLPERQESAEVVQVKAAAIARLIQNAKNLIAFTGAGISTASGIPDFRGPTGVWTMRDKGLKPLAGTPVAIARPSYTHLALKALVDAGICKAIISQNTDGLHARSGVPLDTLYELHGNSYKAVCWKCGHRQLYRSQVRTTGKAHGTCKSCLKRVPRFCHCTSHACPSCGTSTPLRTTIIHFGENLEVPILTAAEEWGQRADVCLALGSSLTVTPAAGIPEGVANGGGALVIVNKQDTPLDGKAVTRVQAPVDDVMARVMRILGIEVPAWDEGAFWASHASDVPTSARESSRSTAGATAAAATPGAAGATGSLSFHRSCALPAPQANVSVQKEAPAAVPPAVSSARDTGESYRSVPVADELVRALITEYAGLSVAPGCTDTGASRTPAREAVSASSSGTVGRSDRHDGRDAASGKRGR